MLRPQTLSENAHAPQIQSSRRRTLRPAGGAVGGLAVSAERADPGIPCRRRRCCLGLSRTCSGASGPGGWDLRLGARHGPAGRDARVPGGAETAAERAADPGVRPGVGVWAPGHRA